MYIQVVASSQSTTRFAGKFQVQFVSKTITCTFSLEKAKGATFQVDGSGTNNPKPIIQGTTAHIDLNITGS